MNLHSLLRPKAFSTGQLFPLLILALFTATFATGCGYSDGVRGKVTLDGEPLANARVQFTPQGKDGRIASGKTDSSGSYSLKTSRTVSKVFPGKYRVIITTSMVTGEDEQGRTIATEEKLPAKYHEETELEAVVSEGSNRINFELTN